MHSSRCEGVSTRAVFRSLVSCERRATPDCCVAWLLAVAVLSASCTAPAPLPTNESPGDSVRDVGALDSVDDTRDGVDVLERIAVIGASASAGFNTWSTLGEVVSLARALDATIVGEHGRIVSSASAMFFLSPERAGQHAAAVAMEARPTLLVAVDFLFWFGYGTKVRPEQRLNDLDKALALLEPFECPVLISTLPDMRRAIGKMLRARQVPRPALLERLNQGIRDWASERDNVRLVDLAGLLEDLEANRAFELRETKYAEGETRALLQWDRLHPTAEGLCALSVVISDAILRVEPRLSPEEFDLDARSVYRRLVAEIRSNRLDQRPGPNSD